ncbi:MAG: NUDIX domain-containing protein [Anaerolineales bacterium]|nr:NUDIX domain-containing protein [Anaerolineales bacterium]
MWKDKVARLVAFPLAYKLMHFMVRLVVPRTRLGVAAVAVNEANEVFMVCHVFHPVYQWGLPGGWLKRNEAPADGALRELREETGLTANLGPVVAVQHDPVTAYVGIAYVATLQPGNLQLSHELSDARWFASDALPTPITQHTRNAIEAAVAYRKNQGIGDSNPA